MATKSASKRSLAATVRFWHDRIRDSRLVGGTEVSLREIEAILQRYDNASSAMKAQVPTQARTGKIKGSIERAAPAAIARYLRDSRLKAGYVTYVGSTLHMNKDGKEGGELVYKAKVDGVLQIFRLSFNAKLVITGVEPA